MPISRPTTISNSNFRTTGLRSRHDRLCDFHEARLFSKAGLLAACAFPRSFVIRIPRLPFRADHPETTSRPRDEGATLAASTTTTEPLHPQLRTRVEGACDGATRPGSIRCRRSLGLVSFVSTRCGSVRLLAANVRQRLIAEARSFFRPNGQRRQGLFRS